MTVYLVAQLEIDDRDQYSKYSDGFMAVFSQFNGTLLAVDEETEALEGNWAFSRTVLISFPTEADAKSWYNSDAYQQLARHRFESSSANIVLVKGFE